MKRISIFVGLLMFFGNIVYGSNLDVAFNQEQNLSLSKRAENLKEEIEQKENFRKIDILNIYNLLLDSDHERFFPGLSYLNELLLKENITSEYLKDIYYKDTTLNLQEELAKLVDN